MSIKIKRILVAKDLSKESSNVIRYALELGSKFDAQVHVLHPKQVRILFGFLMPLYGQ